MNDSNSDYVRPDEVIPPPGDASVQLRGLAKDAVMFLPNMIKLLGRLVKDPRVPRRSKILMGGVIAYLVSPVDLIPDAIPVVGVADDLLLAAYVLNHVMERAGEEIILEHWDGPQDLLQLVRSVLEATSSMVPKSIRKWIDRLSG
jgi:uncharacterized membrane protein YkvA (DUF1232 family)